MKSGKMRVTHSHPEEHEASSLAQTITLESDLNLPSPYTTITSLPTSGSQPMGLGPFEGGHKSDLPRMRYLRYDS